MNNILYITYDGLIDPLGQSQIIPYLEGLSGHYNITVISCEKRKDFYLQKSSTCEHLKQFNIDWQPLSYTKIPPVLSTIFDILKITMKAYSLHCRKSLLRILFSYLSPFAVSSQGFFSVVHCRSYIASYVGLHMKHKFKTKFIFDMRGFWADERVEGNIWNKKNPIFSVIYKYFKKKEIEFLSQADYTVSLTEKARGIIHSWQKIPGQPIPIRVIPCCVDLNLFSPEKVTENELISLREHFSFGIDDFIVSYIGSLGTWYLLDEMLFFFSCLLKMKNEAKFLFITNEIPESIIKKAVEYKIPREKILIKKAIRAEVPALLMLSTISVFFIKPSFSKSASSPTKLGELFAMGIPVVCNSGIGDIDKTLEEAKSGIVIDHFDEQSFFAAIGKLDELISVAPLYSRGVAKTLFSLEEGVKNYEKVYQELISL